MEPSKRIMFTFDRRSYDVLTSLKEAGQFTSMAHAVRDALSMVRALQEQAKQGFTEIVARNPETKEERVLVLPLPLVLDNDAGTLNE